MKVIIAGTRTITDYSVLLRAIENSCIATDIITEIVSGHANGVDKMGEKWAALNNKKLVIMGADWKHLGRPAGVIRNQEMAKYGDFLIAIWDGVSRGTKNMIETAVKMGLPVYIEPEIRKVGNMNNIYK